MSGKCQYCGLSGFKNVSVHERYCAKKPSDAQVGVELPKQEKEVQNTKADTQPATLQIIDVQPYGGELVAWFQDTAGNKQLIPIDCRGTLLTEPDNRIPCVLVLTNEGYFIPPFMIAGFIGVYPRDMEWAESEPDEEGIEADPTLEPETSTAPEDEGEDDERGADTPAETPYRDIPSRIEPEKPKAGFLSGLFKPKEKPMTYTPKETASDEGKQLLKQLNDATKTR